MKYFILVFCILLCSISSAQQITNVQLDGSNSACRGLWHHELNSGTTLYDVSGMSNNGDINGAIWNDNGIIGKALYFDGDDDFVIISSGVEYGTADGSMSVWFKPAQDYDGSQATLNITSMRSKGFYIYLAGGGVIRAYGNDGYAGDWLDTTTVMWSSGTWYNVVETWNATDQLGKIYVNGIYENSVAYDGSFGISIENEIKFGMHYSVSDRRFNGLIDEICFSSYTHTQAEIVYIYTNQVGLQ